VTDRSKRKVPSRRALIYITVVAAVVATTVTASLLSGGSRSHVEKGNALLLQGERAQKKGDLGSAIKDYRQVVTEQPTNALAIYDLGTVAQLRGDRNAAKQYYQRVLKVNPRYVNALLNLAILVTPGDPHYAESLYRKALSVMPDEAVLHLNLGYLLERLGKKTDGEYQIAVAVALQQHRPVPSAPSFGSAVSAHTDRIALSTSGG